MAFWGIEVKPGTPYVYCSDGERGRLHISQATLGLEEREYPCMSTKSILQCKVGDMTPIFLCSLLPERQETCQLNLEFEEDDEVTFSILGSQSMHLSGFFYGGSGDRDDLGHDCDSDSSDEDFVLNGFKDEDDSEDDCDYIDDGLEMYPPSPIQNSGVKIEEIVDDKKVNENDSSKQKTDTSKALAKSAETNGEKTQKKSDKGEIPKDENNNYYYKTTPKGKVLKVKCSATDKLPDKNTPSNSQTSDRPTLDAKKSAIKVCKIIFSNKTKPENLLLVETSKPSIIIKPPVEADKDQPHKKIIIKQPKEMEKTKAIDQQPAYELLRYEESVRREREEEQRAKENKKRKPEIKDEYLDEFSRRINDRRVPERDRVVRRTEVEHVMPAQEYTLTPKRRRGEVGLSNILESIVETLKGRKEISYLFLKPVTKKEAPDYLDIISRPMDLSTIRDKVRRLEYKNRGDFRHDVFQIVFNAHKYYDRRNPGIPPLADQVLELCEFLLDQYDEPLTEAESGIE